MSGLDPASSPAAPRRAPRWSMVGTVTPGDRCAAGVDGGAAGEQGDGLGRPAVVVQDVEVRVLDVDLVAVERVAVRPPEPPVPNRSNSLVGRQAADRVAGRAAPARIGATIVLYRVVVPLDGVEAAGRAAGRDRVVGDGGVVDRQDARVVDAAAVAALVAGDGRIGHVRRAGVGEAAAGGGRRLPLRVDPVKVSVPPSSLPMPPPVGRPCWTRGSRTVIVADAGVVDAAAGVRAVAALFGRVEYAVERAARLVVEAAARAGRRVARRSVDVVRGSACRRCRCRRPTRDGPDDPGRIARDRRAGEADGCRPPGPRCRRPRRSPTLPVIVEPVSVERARRPTMPPPVPAVLPRDRVGRWSQGERPRVGDAAAGGRRPCCRRSSCRRRGSGRRCC